MSVVVGACVGYILGFVSVLVIEAASSVEQEDEDDLY